MIELRQATPREVRAVATSLCQQDRTELALFGCASAEDEVVDSYRSARVCSVVLGDDGSPVALCGVSGFEPGRVWMLRTPGLWATRSHRRQIPGIARGWLNSLPEPVLFNWALASNGSNLKWLRSLGFVVDSPRPMGRSLALFSYFWRRKT